MKKKLSILYIRTDIESGALKSGGSVAHTLGVLKGFIAQECSIVCASSVMEDLIQKVSITAFVKLCVPRWCRFVRWRLTCVLSNIFFTYQLLACMKQKKIDYLYARYSIFNCSAVLVQWIKKVPLILEYNGSEAWIDKHWSKKSWFKLSLLARVIERVNIQAARYIVVVSEALQQELIMRGIPASKILVNPNGVDTHRYNPARLADHRTTIRLQYAIHNRFVVGFIGTFSKWHGIELLAKIIPRVCALDPHIHFMVIGQGVLFESFKQQMEQLGLVGPFVTLTGQVEQYKAKRYLSACDAFVCPTQPNPDGSTFFGSPTKLFEYMSLAQPILASDIGQLPEVLYPALKASDIIPSLSPEHTHRAILVPARDVEAWVSGIWAVAQMNTAVREQFGLNARAKAEEELDWKHHVTRITEFIQQGT